MKMPIWTLKYHSFVVPNLSDYQSQIFISKIKKNVKILINRECEIPKIRGRYED